MSILSYVSISIKMPYNARIVHPHTADSLYKKISGVWDECMIHGATATASATAAAVHVSRNRVTASRHNLHNLTPSHFTIFLLS